MSEVLATLVKEITEHASVRFSNRTFVVHLAKRFNLLGYWPTALVF